MTRWTMTGICAATLMACEPAPLASQNAGSATQESAGATLPSATRPFSVAKIAEFDEPWAMTFLPDTPYALVTEKSGKLILFSMHDRSKIEVSGVPAVAYGGQGGLGDVIVAPGGVDANGNFSVYLSYAEPGDGDTRGAAVALAMLDIDETGKGAATLRNLKVIWRQQPKVTGRGHFGHRLALSPDKRHLFITSGERQKFDPAQDMGGNLGKVVRLLPDGSVPPNNPFADKGGVTAQIWSYGHRNMLGIAFDSQGRLWVNEMGPEGGDEVNLIKAGDNYGWPRASNGSHYGGRAIPDHKAGDGFHAPALWWTPVISPAGFVSYNADLFPQWKGSLFLGALSGEALVRIAVDGGVAKKADHWDMKQRIREVEVGPDGALWLLEDGPGAGLLKLTPAK